MPPYQLEATGAANDILFKYVRRPAILFLDGCKSHYLRGVLVLQSQQKIIVLFIKAVVFGIS